MAIDRSRFLRVFVMSLVLTGVVVGAIATGGVALAVPTAGVGGFVVEFSSLQGQGFTQYATLENSSDCAAYPSAVAKINKGTINDLHLYKDIPVPKEVPGNAKTVRVLIKSKQAKFTGLTQKFTYLRGDLTFNNGQQIGADGGASKPQGRFSITSPSVVIGDGHIEAQSQFVDSISLKNAQVTTSVNPKDSGPVDSAVCAANTGSGSSGA